MTPETVLTQSNEALRLALMLGAPLLLPAATWALRVACVLGLTVALVRGRSALAPPSRPPTPLLLYVYAHAAVFLAFHLAPNADVCEKIRALGPKPPPKPLTTRPTPARGAATSIAASASSAKL